MISGVRSRWHTNFLRTLWVRDTLVYSIDQQMIIEQNRIKREIARVVSGEGYLPLQEQDFVDICPNPTWGIHVRAQSVDVLLCYQGYILSKSW